jgi:hypothetical protein
MAGQVEQALCVAQGGASSVLPVATAPFSVTVRFEVPGV